MIETCQYRSNKEAILKPNHNLKVHFVPRIHLIEGKHQLIWF